jgi:hypothetical protein
MLPVGFEPTISSRELSQNYALDREANIVFNPTNYMFLPVQDRYQRGTYKSIKTQIGKPFPLQAYGAQRVLGV